MSLCRASDPALLSLLRLVPGWGVAAAPSIYYNSASLARSRDDRRSAISDFRRRERPAGWPGKAIGASPIEQIGRATWQPSQDQSACHAFAAATLLRWPRQGRQLDRGVGV